MSSFQTINRYINNMTEETTSKPEHSSRPIQANCTLNESKFPPIGQGPADLLLAVSMKKWLQKFHFNNYTNQ